MPRIEIIGAQDIDICMSCADGAVLTDNLEAQEVPDWNLAGDIGSIEVEHPSYTEDDYKCHICGKKLSGVDEVPFPPEYPY